MDEQQTRILQIWQRILCLLGERIITFRRILMYNRRRTWLRIQERQRILRFQYIHRLIDLQNQFILQIPRPLKRRINSSNSSLNLDEFRNYNENDWLENFRVSKKTFQEICDIVKHDLSPRVSAVRNPIPLEKRVAIALYKIATGAEYRFISNRFNVAKSTVCKFLKTFCESLINRVGNDIISMPHEKHEILQINEEFQKITNLPLIIGTIDLIHIPVNVTSGMFRSYINNGGWASILLQAVVDHNLSFRKVDIISREPSVFVNNSFELPKMNGFTDEHLISYYLIGSSSYPLRPWLMKKYATPHNNEQRIFNENIDKALNFPKEAFRRLVSRFQVLSKKVDIEYKTMTSVISACCILQNLIEKNHDNYKEEWFEQMNPMFFQMQNTELNPDGLETQEGKKVRKLLTKLC